MSEEKQHIDNPQIKKEEPGAEIEKENIGNIEKTYDIEGLVIGC